MNDITYIGLDVHKTTVCVAIARAAAVERYERLAYSRTGPTSCAKWWIDQYATDQIVLLGGIEPGEIVVTAGT
jgi:hypothetical protein